MPSLGHASDHATSDRAGRERAACPECDKDGDADDSWYSSVDAGVLGENGTVLEDADVSVGENEQGRFTWFQYCLQVLDVLGNFFVLTFEAFVSEEGADVDGSVTVNGETLDVEETPLGALDDATWKHMKKLPVNLPVGHKDLPQGVDVDQCVDVDGLALGC